jgi:type I restriction enzyme S subunit
VKPLLFGRKGSIGEINFSSTPCSPIDTTYYIDQFYGMPAKFWFYRLKSAKLSDLNKATAIPGLNRNDAYDVSIGIPPLSEQKRIADKLDSLLARVDSCQSHLERVPEILKRFRQSVLTTATSGRLTEMWREERGLELSDWTQVPAGDLIEKIEAGINVKCEERPPLEYERGLVKISAVTWGKYNR